MSFKKRILQATTGLALAGALTFFNTQEAEASTWTANTAEEIKAEIEAQNPGQDGNIKYEFQWGDTLSAIADAVDVELNKLVQINNIQNADLIIVGGKIYLNEDASVVSIEDNNTVRSYDVSEEVVHETETPAEVTQESSSSQASQSTNNGSQASQSQESTQTQSQTTSSQASSQSAQVSQTQAPAAPTGSVYSIATSQLGAPYAYGGSTPAGFDCSGFVNWVFARAGRSVPRTSASLYAASTPVSNPQVGDLVFFGSGRVTHVGIYAGGGQFIGAQTSTGVAHASVHSGYWGARFIGYGRI